MGVGSGVLAAEVRGRGVRAVGLCAVRHGVAALALLWAAGNCSIRAQVAARASSGVLLVGSPVEGVVGGDCHQACMISALGGISRWGAAAVHSHPLNVMGSALGPPRGYVQCCICTCCNN